MVFWVIVFIVGGFLFRYAGIKWESSFIKILGVWLIVVGIIIIGFMLLHHMVAG